MNLIRITAVSALLCLSTQAGAALNVFACVPEWAALVKELGGDKVNVYQASNALQDPHRIEARPSLIAKMRQADLLVCTGAELEVGWLPVLLQTAGNNKVQAGTPGHFMAADQVQKLECRRRSIARWAMCIRQATRTFISIRATSPKLPRH